MHSHDGKRRKGLVWTLWLVSTVFVVAFTFFHLRKLPTSVEHQSDTTLQLIPAPLPPSLPPSVPLPPAHTDHIVCPLPNVTIFFSTTPWVERGSARTISGCLVVCTLTTVAESYSTAHAVGVHPDRQAIPPKRAYADQKRIYFNWESTVLQPWIHFDFFARRDIYFDLFVTFLHPPPNSMKPFLRSNYWVSPEKLCAPYKRVERHRVTENATIFMNNCNTMRQKYVQQLEHLGITIQRFGNCNANARMEDYPECESRTHHTALKKRKWCVGSHYDFYFAFEVAQEEGYVTESVWDGLMMDTVVVYRGAPDVDNYMPTENCIIDAGKMTPKELVNYLQLVASNTTLYNLYKDWRSRPIRARFWDLGKTRRELDTCRACMRLAGCRNVTN